MALVLNGIRVPALFYADDIVLLVRSPEELQCMLDVCTDYADKWLFQFHNDKSAVVAFGTVEAKVLVAAAAAAGVVQWSLGGRPLPVSDHYRYLGLEFSNVASDRRLRKRKWDLATSRFRTDANHRMEQLMWMCAVRHQHGVAPNVTFSLWRSLVRPCELWWVELSKSTTNELEQLAAAFARRALSLPAGAPTAFAMGELGMGSIASHHDELALRLFGRLATMPSNRLAARVFQSRITDPAQALPLLLPCRSLVPQHPPTHGPLRSHPLLDDRRGGLS